MKNKSVQQNIPLSVVGTRGGVRMFSKYFDNEIWQIVSRTSKDGNKFSKQIHVVTFKQGRNLLNPSHVISMKVYAAFSGYIATIGISEDHESIKFFQASSLDGLLWKILSEVARDGFPIASPRSLKVSAFYYSDKSLWAKLAETSAGSKPARLFAASRPDSWDSEPLRIIGVVNNMLVYDSPLFSRASIEISVGIISFAPAHPDEMLSRTISPVWFGRFNTGHLEPLGAAYIKGTLIVFWKTPAGEIFSTRIGDMSGDTDWRQSQILKRAKSNPIISPREDVSWESNGTFNPAAFLDDEGQTHLLYRAIGADGISRIGHVESTDGIHFHKRSIAPVYEENITLQKHLLEEQEEKLHRRYDPAYYTSGGSWSGAEDPRAVRIGNRIYMLYVSFEGWDSIRVALTSIDMRDLKSGRWLWKAPRMISPPHDVVKNWLLFPEKIKGKYAIMHSIVPNVLVDYFDNLDYFDDTHFIQSPRLRGPQPGRRGFWDSIIRGPAAPPLRIAEGWLLLYHAIDRRDPNKYKLGAMILDAKNPSKILYRSNEPMLAPDAWYENEGKPGVIYASGAVIHDDTLYIYYGGGDRVVCVATASLQKFVDHIKHGVATQMRYHKLTLE